MTPRSRRLFSNLLWGGIGGFLLSLFYVVVLMILFVAQGPRLFAGYDTTFGTVAAAYVAAGVFGGLLVGALRPLLRFRWGAALVGVAAAVPMGVGVRLIQMGLAPWSTEDTVVLAIFSAAIGAPVGWISWSMFRNTL
jgi:hypothetical protein